MSEDAQKLREELIKLGIILPEWLARLLPTIEGDVLVVEEVGGKVYFPLSQFSKEEVELRFENLKRNAN